MRRVLFGQAAFLICCLIFLSPVRADAPGTISYQGLLTKPTGQPVVDGSYAIKFHIYDAAISGTLLWAESLTVNTIDGRFMVALGQVHPVSAFLFSSPDRWLGMAVGSDAEMSPRTKFSAVPYALSVAGGGGSGAYLPLSGGMMTGPITSTGNPPITMGKGNFGEGCSNTGLNAFVAGGYNVAPGELSVVCGGGAYDEFYGNKAWGDFSAIVGGSAHRCGEYSFVGGGFANCTDSGSYAAIVGGWANKAYGGYAFVGCGYANNARGDRAFIGTGILNLVQSHGGTICNGYADTVTGAQAFVGTAIYSKANGPYATIINGWWNTAGQTGADSCATISGGALNYAKQKFSYVGGGSADSALGQYSTVAGGYGNTASGQNASIGGGYKNLANGNYATVVGGYGDTASADYATALGGNHNFAASTCATVVGGQQNVATGPYSVILGGSQNYANGWRAVAAGLGAHAFHDNTFVYGDGTPADYYSDHSDQAKFRVNGGFKIDFNGYSTEFYNTGTNVIYVSNGARLTTGGTWTNASDRSLKENFEDVDGEQILEKLERLPITEWNYRSESTEVKHIGPTAQDFYQAFGVGNDTTSISTIDPSGIALAAIKALHQKSKELDELKGRLEKLEALVEQLSSAPAVERKK